MRPKTKLTLAAIALAATLAGCAGPMPKADPNEAWVGLQDDVADAMLAEKVDGRRVNDGRYFEVKPGDHKLSVLLFHVYTANEADNCTGSLDYSHFRAGQRYTLVESKRGPEVNVKLDDAQGKALAAVQDMSCMPS